MVVLRSTPPLITRCTLLGFAEATHYLNMVPVFVYAGGARRTSMAERYTHLLHGCCHRVAARSRAPVGR
jgi:hypothetical protein